MGNSSASRDDLKPGHSSHSAGAGSPPGRQPLAGRPVVFGEVLLDHFPDGRKILGGAPFNVAWNLRGLGLDPYFVSAVGDDSEGNLIRQRMFQWGLDVDGLQTVAGRSTGQVKVSLVDGQPSFEIMEDQAYDFVKPPELEFSSDRFRLLYHGSLILRGDRTHVTLADVIAKSRLPRFVDINIRQPHFQRSWVAELLWGATWVKLNDAELAFLSGRDVHDQEGVETGVRKLRDEFGDATYFVTCGAKGAYAVDRSEVHFASAPPPEVLRDTVGAGDAFASATIAGLLAGWSTAEILESGVRFASRICGITGATSMETSLYQEVVP